MLQEQQQTQYQPQQIITEEKPQIITDTKRPKTINDILLGYKDKIAEALPRHLTADRMMRLVMTEMGRVPKLKECTPASLIGSILTCSQLGLELGPLGHAYLVAYKNSKLNAYECQFILGYKGMITLVRRSAEVQSISAHEVYMGDRFDFAFGLVEKCDHIPTEGERGAFRGAYAVVRFKDGSHQFDYLSAFEINKIRDKSADYKNWVSSGKKWREPIWQEFYGEMAKKSVIRRMFKYLPVSTEIQRIVSLDEMADRNEQRSASIIDGELEGLEAENLPAPRDKADEVSEKLSI